MTDTSSLDVPTATAMAFSKLFVVSDGEAPAAGVLDAVKRLSIRGTLPVEILTVDSPGMPSARAHEDMQRLCERIGLRTRITVLHSNAVPEAVEDRVGSWMRREAGHGKYPRPLLCLATHARGPILGIVLGSVSETIVRMTRYPMLLIGPRARAITTFSERLLVGVDATHESDGILDVAQSWVQSFGGTVHLFCVNGPGEDDRMSRRHLRAAREWLEQRDIMCQTELFEASSVPGAILETAKRFGISAIAMTTRGSSPIRRLQVGSTALEVLAGAARPVLLLNPHGFRTVVTPAAL